MYRCQMSWAAPLNVIVASGVADVYVGTRAGDRADRTGWATLTLDLQSDVTAAKNATARIGQNTACSQSARRTGGPEDAAAGNCFRNGDTIPLQNSTAFPHHRTERWPPSAPSCTARHLNLGRSQPRSTTCWTARRTDPGFPGKAGRFTAQLNEQREDLTRAIDSTNQLLTKPADRDKTLGTGLNRVPTLIKHFADQRSTIADAVQALGRFSKTTDEISPVAYELRANLQLHSAAAGNNSASPRRPCPRL